MNSTWSSDKTQLGMDTLKAMHVTKVNFTENCTDFYKMRLAERDLLILIYGSDKYKSAPSSFNSNESVKYVQ